MGSGGTRDDKRLLVAGVLMEKVRWEQGLVGSGGVTTQSS